MTMKRYLIFVSALLALAACNKDGTQVEDGALELRLTSGVQARTRATHGLDTQLAAGEKVHVSVTDAGTSEQLYANNALTVGEDNSTLSGGDPMYFPNSRNAVNIYAIHGNFSTDLSLLFEEMMIHNVATDQQSSGIGYANSDLLYCELHRVGPTKHALVLHFDHVLSKVEITLTEGAGNPVITKAEILNTQMQATFLHPDPDGNLLTSAYGEPADILIDCETGGALNEAVIVPQTLSSGTQFIRITIEGGAELYYTLPSDVPYAAGKKYRYNITANLTEISVTTEVSDWTDGGSDSSTMKLESHYDTDLSTAEVGDFITKSGYLLHLSDFDQLTETELNEITGVVFWTPDVAETIADGRSTPASLSSDKIMAQDHPDCTHGLAVAVKTVTYDNAETIIWQGTNFSCVGNWQSSSFVPDSKYDKSDFVSVRSGTGATDQINYIYGYQNTVVYRAYNKYYKDNSSNIIRPVAALDDFEETCPSPANSTGWFFASLKEMHMLCYKDVDDVFNSSDGTDTRDKINAVLSKIGGDELKSGYTWSSTEYGTMYTCFFLSYSDGNVRNSALRNTSNLKVRAVCSL